ncbi:PrsW family intramembrane metalloprotease [Alicyclobacillus sp. ALC3]|uniref:PrsW family intramembrane metalloprotease n=1 Tax=Alicyclobacillus sp. ALC3 TaxID=2796143 RepID=UPI002377E43E|nr:PrsW family glutamic-type intramembrane protease [Alicyclobacillus sp. ALC3]
METITYAALALVPVLVLMAWLYTRDRIHPEPKRAVFRLFLLGAGIVLPAGLLERAMLGGRTELGAGWQASILTAFFIAGLVEEFLKAAIVERGAIARGLVVEPLDCLIYSGATALGFAAVENVLYVTSSGFNTAVLRSVTAVPAHLMFGIIMGHFFARSIWNSGNRALAYIVPAGAHGVYDSFALSSTLWADACLVVYLLALVEVCLHILDRYRRATLHTVRV